MAVDLFHWTPVRPVINLPLVRRFSPKRALKNFGDEIGPMIVRAIIDERGLVAPEASDSTGRLFSVGSVLHFATAGDHVWGTGINGKISKPLDISPCDISIHAVRGPRTKERLESLGFEVPAVFGDPGLLLPHVDSRYAALHDRTKRRKLAVIPNLNELGDYKRHPDFVSPLQDPLAIAQIIAESEFVTGSSLHAMVFADALGTPSRLIASKAEHPFKYEDYYLGTGRRDVVPADSVDAALRIGGSDAMPFDAERLLAAFPAELF